MPKATETQKLIDELCAPTICQPIEVKGWIKDTTAIVGGFGQQLALVRGLVHDADDEEPTMEVRGKMEAIIQQIDAQTRIIGKIAQEVRSLRVSLRLLAEQVSELRDLADAAGYVIPDA